MVGKSLSDGLESIWKKSGHGLFEALFQNFPGKTGKPENPQSY
jgi:hypothetical protein